MSDMDLRLAAVLAANPQLEDLLLEFEASKPPINTTTTSLVGMCRELAPWISPVEIWQTWTVYYRDNGRISDGHTISSSDCCEPRA